MPVKKDEDRPLKSHTAGRHAMGAAIDAKERSAAAYEAHQEFFDDPAYAARVDAAIKTVDEFFKVKDMYVNQRANRGKPFTTIKVTNHIFPKCSLSEKDRRYRQPLAAVGAEIVFSGGTNSYLIRIH